MRGKNKKIKIEKTCIKCKETFPIDSFRFLNKEKGYRKSYCKPCENRELLERKRITGGLKLKEQKRLIRESVDLEFKNRRFLRKKNAKYKSLYGITLEQFSEMETAQERKCKICTKETKLVVDHCHKTGKVRGLLCQACNKSLGGFYDNTKALQSAIKYLEEASNAPEGVQGSPSSEENEFRSTLSGINE